MTIHGYIQYISISIICTCVHIYLYMYVYIDCILCYILTIDCITLPCCFLGYYGEGLNAIIVFAACYLPDSGCEDYTYIMENLFL